MASQHVYNTCIIIKSSVPFLLITVYVDFVQKTTGWLLKVPSLYIDSIIIVKIDHKKVQAKSRFCHCF